MKLTLFALLALATTAPAFAQDPAPVPTRQEALDLQNSGDLAGAEAAWTARRAADPKDGDATFHLGYVLHMAGKLKEAHDMHLEATAFPEFAALANYNHACVHALWNEPDPAFEALDAAVKSGFKDNFQLNIDTDLASLRSDDRYGILVARIADLLKNGDQAQDTTSAEPASTPKEAPATPLSELPNERRMDFFLGTWNVTKGEEKSVAEVGAMFDGGAIRASMYDQSTKAQRTEATYFPTEDGWRMLWINNKGERATLNGSLRGERMIFDLVSMNGEPATGSRAMFSKLESAGFRYTWQVRNEKKKWDSVSTWRYER